MMRVKSSTRMSFSGRASCPYFGKGRGSASPMRSMVIRGCEAIAWPCAWRSHSSKLRMAATTMPASAATCSKSSAFQRLSARSTVSRVVPSPVGQPSTAKAPSR
ncbi:hypothetical protein G6F40_017985 [Rhizopus arrhizus]|nr:hypothetical protein G6F40_017985 [Rhizopus arrhizus]